MTMRKPNAPRRFFRIDPDAAGVQREVDDELRFHFEMTVQDLVAKGMTLRDARREAERRFGDVRLTRERLTDIDRQRVNKERRARVWSALAHDLRYTLRGLRLKPGFATVVVIALALGIGANATMFDIVDRLLFRPPAHLIAPERTHHLYFQRVVDGGVFTGNGAQYQRFLDLTSSATTTEVVAAFSTRRVAVGVGENTRELTLGAMSASLWQLFDARPVIGRFFGAAEDREPGGARVAVLSYGYWKSQYGGADSVLGKTISIGPAPYTVIGVAPQGFAATQMLTPSAFIPIAVSAVDSFGEMWQRYRATYNITWLEIFVRRKPNVSVEAMTADLSAGYRRSYEAQVAIQPHTPPIDVARPRVLAYPVFEERGPSPSADTRVATWLLGVAGIVLLIACANVGNLLLGRAVYRQREIAVRMALGVGRARLFGQLLVESLVLAFLGAVGGIVVAQWGGRVLRALLIPQVEWEGAIGDARVLLFAGAIALCAGILAGLAPIVHSRRTDVATALKAGVREGHGHRSRLRSALLMLQAALSVVLLIGAGLFVRSLQKISAVDPGYDVRQLLFVEPHLRGTQLDSARQRQLYETLTDRARAYPGVADASLALTVPFNSTYSDDLYLPGADSASKLGEFIMQGASASYFATTGTRIVRGRAFNAQDRTGSPPVIIVSQSVADGLWPKQDALGKCVKASADTAPCREVVGIAENVKIGSFASDWDLVYYLPEAQLGTNAYALFLRTRGQATDDISGLHRALQSEMPGAGYVVLKPFEELVGPSMRSWQLGATMFAVFGGLALALAAIGLYSVVAHSVVQRTHEMGVRVALGASRAEVVRLVVRESLRIVVAGVAVGAAASLTGGRWLQPLLFGVTPRDPLVLLLVALLLPAVALAASFIPAWRAAQVQPNVALRTD